MKRILSVLMVLAMLLTMLLSFTSCAKVNEKKVEENPQAAIENALDASKDGFFGDKTGVKEVADKAAALSIVFESEALLPGIKKIGLSINSDATTDKAVFDVFANINNEDLAAKLFVDKNGAIVSGKDLLGSDKALAVNFTTFLANMSTSPLFQDLPAEAVTQIKDMVSKLQTEVTKVMDKTEADTQKNLNDIYKLLGMAVTAEKVDKTDCVVITYTVNNTNVEAVVKHIAKPMLEMNEEIKDSLDEAIAEMNETMTIDLAAKIYISKKDNTLAKMTLNGTLTNKEDAEQKVTVDVALNEKELTAKVATGEETLEVKVTYTEEADKIAINAEATMKEGEDSQTIKGSYTYTKSTGKFVLAAEMGEMMKYELGGSIKVENKKTATIVIDSLKMGEQEAPAFKLTVTLGTEANVPAFPTDAKDFITLSVDEIADIAEEIKDSKIITLIQSMS